MSAAPAGSVGWMRKALAMSMHLACLAFFGLTVVWPLASPIVNGGLAREFAPAIEAWTTWLAWVRSPGN